MWLALVLCVTAGLAARVTPAYADEVRLTGGDRISGRLIALTRATVRIESAAAGVIEIDRRLIERLSTDEPRVVDLASGDRITGRLLDGPEGTVTIRSTLVGDVRVPLDVIDAVHLVDPSGAASREPPTLEPADGLSRVRGRGAGSAGGQDQAADPTGGQGPRPIGQAPEDLADIRLLFLRQATVLLRPGQVEIETAVGYEHTQAASAIFDARFRQFQVPLSARVGLFDRAEAFVSLPAAYVRRDLGFADSGVTSDEAGVGDLTAGFNYEVRRESAGGPDVVTSVGVGIPTGSTPDEDGLSLGSAHWTATVGVQFITITDPVALFAGVRFEHQFPARYFLGDAVHDVDPGPTGGYNFGFGFAVSENVSLSAQVVGSYQAEARADGERVFGSSSEPVSWRSALTYRYSGRTYVEPSVAIGLNDDTPDFALGLSLTHRFGR